MAALPRNSKNHRVLFPFESTKQFYQCYLEIPLSSKVSNINSIFLFSFFSRARIEISAFQGHVFPFIKEHETIRMYHQPNGHQEKRPISSTLKLSWCIVYVNGVGNFYCIWQYSKNDIVRNVDIHEKQKEDTCKTTQRKKSVDLKRN